MDEELENTLNNEELDTKGRLEAIKKLIGDNYVPTKKYSDDVSTVKNENKQLKADIKARDTEIEGYKNSQLTDDEKLQKALKEAEEATRKATIKENKYEVKDILSSIIEDKKELETIASSITTADLEASKSIATEIANTMKKTKETAEAKIRQELINNTPKPNGGEEKKPMTKDEFFKLGYNEQVKYKQENPEGYKQLFN